MFIIRPKIFYKAIAFFILLAKSGGLLYASSLTYDVASGQTKTVTSKLTGTGPLTKTGPGELDLNNTNNTFTGGIAINAGTVSIRATGTLGKVYSASQQKNRTVTFARNGVLSTDPTNSSGVVTLTSVTVGNGITATLWVNNVNASISSPVLGTSGLLQVSGLGPVSIMGALPAGALNYSVGDITNYSTVGTLQLSSAAATGATGFITVLNGGMLDLATNSAGDSALPDGSNSGGASIKIMPGGTIKFGGGVFSRNIALS